MKDEELLALEMAAAMLAWCAEVFTVNMNKCENPEDAQERVEAMREVSNEVRGIITARLKARELFEVKRHNTDKQSMGFRGTEE